MEFRKTKDQGVMNAKINQENLVYKTAIADVLGAYSMTAESSDAYFAQTFGPRWMMWRHEREHLQELYKLTWMLVEASRRDCGHSAEDVKDSDVVEGDIEGQDGKPLLGSMRKLLVPPDSICASPTDFNGWHFQFRQVTCLASGQAQSIDPSGRSIVTLALTLLTSSQAILIVWSKRAGKYEYSVTTANFSVEALKCAFSLAALVKIWKNEGVTADNSTIHIQAFRLNTTLDEVIVYPIPAALYLVKNLLQYYIFAYVDAPGYQILKNLNIISTGVLYRIILKKKHRQSGQYHTVDVLSRNVILQASELKYSLRVLPRGVIL
ncbi:hypothetical protein ACLOJK_033611 [Asimina triloba]